MASIVQHLIPESQTPETLVTATEEMTLQDALDRMIEHDYSQLPVVDKDFKLKGLVTSDSILKTISYFRSSLDKVAVSHAAFKSKTCRPDDELSELLNGLRDASAIPIVDKVGGLIAIITNYDAAEYYRQRAEDIMLAQDIETTLRDYIEYAHKDSAGNIDDNALQKEIENIAPSGKEFKNKFKKALHEYLGRSDQVHSTPNQSLIDDVFEKHLHQPTEIKSFENLTLFEYIQIIKNLWNRYHHFFYELEWDAIYRLLNEVRQTRNAIAHFREVTANQRIQLRYCAQFLERHRPFFQTLKVGTAQGTGVVLPVTISVSTQHMKTEIPQDTEKTLAQEQSTLDESDTDLSELKAPVEIIEPSESRYTPLAIWLQKQEPDEIICSFKQVEDIIQDTLPPSARQHRNWWANDSVGHTQSQQWLEAGWRVSNINLAEETVVFSRIAKQSAFYIHFFNDFISKLQGSSDLRITPLIDKPKYHWLPVKIESKDCSLILIVSFVRKSRLRLEVYIPNAQKNIFEALQQQRAEIESEYGDSLSWEVFPNSLGARIAVYRENSFIKDEKVLMAMQNWLVDILPDFYKTIAKRFHEVEQILLH